MLSSRPMKTELMKGVPAEVSLYEVSLRDGLQNERVTVPLGEKLRLVDALVAAGLRRIEVTSFVSPKWIPQLADADDVAARAERHPDVVFSALCPNARGLERALAAKLPEIAVFMSASETHNKKNINKTIEAIAKEQKRILLVMATGTGKTIPLSRLSGACGNRVPRNASCSLPIAPSWSIRP